MAKKKSKVDEAYEPIEPGVVSIKDLLRKGKGITKVAPEVDPAEVIKELNDKIKMLEKLGDTDLINAQAERIEELETDLTKAEEDMAALKEEIEALKKDGGE
jgi:predicted ATP-grasp superfamily ATP-dependent carboligase